MGTGHGNSFTRKDVDWMSDLRVWSTVPCHRRSAQARQRTGRFAETLPMVETQICLNMWLCTFRKDTPKQDVKQLKSSKRDFHSGQNVCAAILLRT
jgi:hypothetical protein